MGVRIAVDKGEGRTRVKGFVININGPPRHL